MELVQARQIATRLVDSLRPSCERIEIAGSIRRQKPNPKDIEIVFITKSSEVTEGFWDKRQVPLIDGAIDALVQEGVLSWDERVKRRGPKYKRLVHTETGAVVEIFGALSDTWGTIYALRTGPGDFNQISFSSKPQRGAMPYGMRMEGGCLWYLNHKLPTPEERDHFRLLNLPFWPPRLRTKERLVEWLSRRGEDGWNPDAAKELVERMGR